jgi:iron complex outermembrane receptor protein
VRMTLDSRLLASHAPSCARAALGLSLALLLGAGGRAQAQDADPKAPVEEIEVLGKEHRLPTAGATKSNVPLLETPMAVSVVSRERFELQGAQDIEDVLNYSSGVRSEPYGNDTRFDWGMIRGTDFVQYLDGLKVTVGSYNTARADPYGMDRIEIMRGPSTVLYGQGTTAGIINLVSKVPQEDFGGELGIEVGSFSRKQIRADVTGALDPSRHWLYRLVFLQRKSDSNVDFVDDDRLMLAPSFTWAPTQDTQITLRGLYQKDDTGSSASFLPHSGILTLNPNGKVPFDRFNSEPGFDTYEPEIRSIGWTVQHRLSDALQLRQNLRYNRSKVDYRTMYGNSVYQAAPFIDPQQRVISRYFDVSQPVVDLVSADQGVLSDFSTGFVQHHVTAGVDASYFRLRGRSARGDGNPLDLFTPAYRGQPMPELTREPESTQRTLGIYLQDQLEIDRWRLLGAVRQDFTASTLEGSDDERDQALTARAGLLYLSPAGWAPYLSYSQSFQPVAGTNARNERFEPQRGEQWELGIKYQPPGAAYALSATLFRILEKNRLTSDPGDPLNQVQAGEVRSRGFEFEASGELLGNDFVLSYSFTDIEMIQSTTRAEIGRQLTSIPQHLASAWLSRSFPLGENLSLQLGLGVRHIGKSFGYLTSTGTTLTTPSVTLTDAMLALRLRKDWELQLNASNLFDKTYVATCLGRGDCFLGTGRRISARALRRF